MSFTRWLVFVSLASLLLVALRADADEGADRRARLRTAAEALRDRRWVQAAAALGQVRTAFPGTEESLEAWVLEARALLLAGQARPALESTSAFLAAHGQDAWAGRMRHTTADAYAALGEPAKASETLTQLADAATAPLALARIGALHLKLADEDFDGVEIKDDLGRSVKRRDLPRALASYRHALEVGLTPADHVRARERVAQSQEATNDFAGARATWKALSDEFDASREEKQGEKPNKGEDEPKRDPAAQRALDASAERWLVGQGRAALRAGAPDEARPLLRAAQARFPKGALAFETLVLLGEERLLPRGGLVSDQAFQEAVAYLSGAALAHAAHPDVALAQRRLAEAYQARGQAEKAAAIWSALADRAPTAPEAPEARHRAAQALASAGRFDEAVAEWNRFLSAYANHPLWPEVREQIAQAGLSKAHALHARGDVREAIAAWRRFADERPDDVRAPQALSQAAAALRAMGEATAAIELWTALAGRYAATPSAAPARLLVALTLEDDLKRLDDAVKAYEDVLAKHAGTPQAAEATARLARLKGKHLELSMERVLGTAEAPVVRVVSRNVEGLKVRVYRLGVEEYFTRKGTLEGVESLQLEVVKPDLTAQWTFEGYRPFALLQADRPLPVEGPGAFVVVAGDDDLTATVLFLVSDIETVVKRGADGDLLVWAFERATQAPVVGARVLLPSGQGKVREVGVTGADGVWHGGVGGQRARVLVLAEKGPALGAATSDVAQPSASSGGFVTKAHVVTDRPVYRPGQQVSWRAVLLRVEDGVLGLAPRAKGMAQLFDPRGQLLAERAVQASEMSTFSGAFETDGESPLGLWKIRLSINDHGTFEGAFQLLEYRKPEFTVDVVPSRSVVPTGERIQASIRLAYAFGGPVPGAEVEWTARRVARTFSAPDPDDVSFYLRTDGENADRERVAAAGGALIARGSGKTNPDGTLAIEFDSGAADEDGEVIVSAQAEDVTRRWVMGAGRIAVARRDHVASVRAERQLVQPKQPFTVEVRTVDAVGAPVARSGSVSVVRVRRAPVVVPGVKSPPPPPVAHDGRRPPAPPPPQRPVSPHVEVLEEQETELASYPVSTDARGRAEFKLELPEAGRYRLRWKALDARGALVSAEGRVEALGEAQDLSKDARLVAARLLWVEGEEAELLLSTPVATGMALVTYETGRVLEHRFVALSGSSTVMRLPARGRHAPNVTIAAAVPGPGRLLQASTEIVVLRRLQVDLRFAAASAKPGDEVELSVLTRDASGQPVSAEVGLSVLDAALYEIAPDASAPILPAFYGARRGHAVATSSSLGWRTFGVTRETSADLLAEAAAKGGGAAEEMARSALRLAREAWRRGDMENAVAQALGAQEADPGSWDARALLTELRAKPEAQEAFRRLEPALEALDAAKHMAERRPMPTPAAAAPPSAPGGPADKETADAEGGPFEGPQSNSLLGTGGGAGGAFKGRGGSKDRKAAGGERLRESVASLEKNFTGGYDMAGKGYVDASGLLALQADDELVKALTLRSNLRDSALWQPHLKTDKDGKAVVKVKLPDNLTTWRAVAQGVSGNALVGEGRTGLVARRDLLVRVDAPRFLTQSDVATLPTAVHNATDRELEVGVTMKVEGLALEGENLRVKAPPQDAVVVDRRLSAPTFGAARVEVAVVSEAGGDRTEAQLPVLPRGVRFVEGRSGLLATDQGDALDSFVEVPPDVVPGSTRLTLNLQPGVDGAVLEALVALDLYPYGCVEQTVHRYLPALEARAALQAVGSPAFDRLAKLDVAIRQGAARLVSLQSPDGSFGWFKGGSGNLAMSAYALLGLVGARESGVSDLNAAIARAVPALVRLLAQGDEDTRSLAHLALARAGGLDGDAYATTFRRRSDDLTVVGLAWLTQAALAVNRPYDVEELARLLLARRVEQGNLTLWKARAGDCFLGSDREATGLAVRALIEAGMAAPHAERGMAWLLANRPPAGGTTKELAAFVGAAAAHVRTNRVQGFGGTVEVLLDGQVVHTLKTGASSPAAPASRVLLPGGETLSAGRHTLSFRLSGEGRLAWALRLDGVRASEALPEEEHGLRVTRRYLVPDKALLEGEKAPVKPGYDVLRPAARPKVELKDVEQAGSGAPVLVRLVLEAPRDLEYVLIEDPLPAGFEVVDGSVRGAFDWQERRDVKQVFFLARMPKGSHQLEYVLQATHLGRFTALGTLALAMYAPEIHGRAAGQQLSVVPRADASAVDAELPPTPDQLFARAKDLLATKQGEDGRRILKALLSEQPLRDEVVEEIEGLLLRLAIERREAREVVRSREELLRRNAARIPNDLPSARTVAAAYREIGQHEVASTLLRDVVARGYAYEVDWKATLAGRGREVEGLDALERATRGFPASNASASAMFQAAQRWRELRRPEGRGSRPAGKPMDDETLDALWSLTAHFAHLPVADPAGYALVEALRRAKDVAGAGAVAEAFLGRFPESVFADDVRWFLGETRYRSFEEAPSDASAQAVEQAVLPLTEAGRFPRPDGSVASQSDFRARARHLLARVAHVLGNLSKAEALYEQAQEIEDAREALAWLRAKALHTEELRVERGGQAALVPVRFRNLEALSVKVYPVDLQVLFAVRKTLDGLHRIDLSGITPAKEWSVKLPQTKARAEGAVDVPLEVPAESFGAWLVVFKGGDLESSTLFVRTDLVAELQRVGEKVRVHVRRAVGGEPVRGAYVAVSDGQRMRARGLTDARGLFEAPGVGGTAFAVVSQGEQVALAR